MDPRACVNVGQIKRFRPCDVQTHGQYIDGDAQAMRISRCMTTGRHTDRGAEADAKYIVLDSHCARALATLPHGPLSPALLELIS